jgi:hypothetical protein
MIPLAVTGNINLSSCCCRLYYVGATMSFDKIIQNTEFKNQCEEYKLAVLKSAYLEKFLEYVSSLDHLSQAIEARHRLVDIVKFYPEKNQIVNFGFYMDSVLGFNKKLKFVNVNKKEIVIDLPEEKLKDFINKKSEEDQKRKKTNFKIFFNDERSFKNIDFKDSANCYFISVNKLSNSLNGVHFIDSNGERIKLDSQQHLNEKFMDQFKQNGDSITLSFERVEKIFKHNPIGNDSAILLDLISSDLVTKLVCLNNGDDFNLFVDQLGHLPSKKENFKNRVKVSSPYHRVNAIIAI